MDAAVVAMAVGIFEAQAHLWTIFLQVEQLLAVERSSTLPGRNNGHDVSSVLASSSSVSEVFLLDVR